MGEGEAETWVEPMQLPWKCLANTSVLQSQNMYFTWKLINTKKHEYMHDAWDIYTQYNTYEVDMVIPESLAHKHSMNTSIVNSQYLWKQNKIIHLYSHVTSISSMSKTTNNAESMRTGKSKPKHCGSLNYVR